MSDDQTEMLRKTGKTEEFIRFLEAMIQGGQPKLLRNYVEYCNDNGYRERQRRFVAQLPSSTKAGFRDLDSEVRYLVANGQVEQAADLLRKRLAESDAVQEISRSIPNDASNLYDIGRYLRRKDYQDIALKVGEEAVASTNGMFTLGWVYEILLEEGRGSEAERLIADSLQRVAHSSQSPAGGKEQYEALIQIYASAGRWSDIVTLLEDAPNWGVSDVAFLDDQQQRQSCIPFVAARALAGVGRKGEAMRALMFVLNGHPDLDQAYELLLNLDPSGAGAILDRMHRASPMATRPVMWKAKLLQDEGHLVDAERLVRQAIAIDPQDSSAWESETRFQAWAILAGIERAEGKAEAAAADRRKFEPAHKYYMNNGSGRWSLEIDGPVNRMMGLGDNPDDFLLRFAVADDLRLAGKPDEAKEQYLRAARSMAEQLGKTGLNLGWFDMPQYDEEAEKAVEDVITKNPNSAPAYCALADLYSTTDRPAEAEHAYQKALALDRDSLAAWKGLELLELKTELPPDLLEKVWLNEIRLAPTEPRWGTNHVQSFSELWLTADLALRDLISAQEPVFTLTTSADETPDQNYQSDYQRMHNWPPTPGAILGQEDTIQTLAKLIDALPAKALKAEHQ